MVQLRILTPPPKRKRLYLVRHAQSQWNQATEETYSVSDMIGFDHAISEKGLRQVRRCRSSCMVRLVAVTHISPTRPALARPKTCVTESAVRGNQDLAPPPHRSVSDSIPLSIVSTHKTVTSDGANS